MRVLPAAGLAALVAFVFSDALLGRGVFFVRDIHWYWYPHVEAAVRAVAEGSWPLWNPYAAFGLPMLADISGQIAYPLTWLNLVLLPATAFKVYVVVHCLGAGLGLFLLSRRFGLSRLAAFVAAGTWILSGPLLSAPNVLHHFAGLAWLPWVLAALDAVLEQPTPGKALLLGAAAGSQALAGSADLCFMTGLAAAGYAGFTLASRPRRDARVALALLGAALFALALAAVQWLPTAALLRSSMRAYLTARGSAFWSLHPATLADLVVPNLTVDLPLNDALRATLFESREPFLVCLYLGASAAMLAALGALVPGTKARGFALVALLASVLCALGRHAPAYGLLLHLPFVGFLRYPVKYMLPASLFWATLAGLGVEAWLRPWGDVERRRSRLAGAVACGLGLAALLAWAWAGLRPRDFDGLLAPGAAPAALAAAASKLRLGAFWLLVGAAFLSARRRFASAPRALTALLLVAVFADLIPVARSVNALAPPQLLTHRPPILAHLPAGSAPCRIHVVQPDLGWLNRQIRIPTGWNHGWAWVLGLQDMLWPPLAGRWRLYGSYDGILTGLEPPALAVLTDALEPAKGTPLMLKLLRMGSVGYVVSVEDDAIPGLEEVARVPSVYARPIRLFRVPEPLPLAYVVSGARVVALPGAFAVLGDAGFDPSREVLLSTGAPRPPTEGFAGGARIKWRRADALSVETELSAPGYLVLVQGYDEGWTATVDGAPSEVLKADLLFRAVALPAGRHAVEMRYRPAPAVWGAALSLSAIVFGLAYWEMRGRRATEGAEDQGARAVG